MSSLSERKQKTTPFGVDSMIGPALYRAAQALTVCMCVQASSEKVRRAADASIAAKDEEAAKAAEQLQEVQAEEQKAQAHIKTLKEQLTGMRSSRFKANDLLTRCVTMMYAFQRVTSWVCAEQVLHIQSSVF